MLTKQNNSRLNYAGRIVALPVVAFITFAFTVRTNEPVPIQVQQMYASMESKSPVTYTTQSVSDTIPDGKKQINAVDVRKKGDKKINELTLTYTDGSSETLTEAEAVQRGLLNNNANQGSQNKKQSVIVLRGVGSSPADTVKQPLYIVDGKEISKDEMSHINPNDIDAINVLKDGSATTKYGEKGKHGVVEIKMKKGVNSITEAKPDIIFEKAEKPASVNTQAWRSFLEKNLQPIVAGTTKKNIKPATYTVHVRFIVKSDGSLTDFKALNDPGYDFAKQVLEIMPGSPNWIPAEQNGRPVHSYHTQPITFVVTGK